MSTIQELRSVNLNVLPVLRELLRHQSVTLAAKALHLSQSSVSGTLKALREHFDDELLVTVGRDVRLTAKAKELVVPLEHAIEKMHDVLFHGGFDADNATVRFVVAAADYAWTVLAPGVAEILQHRFQGISVRFTQASLASFAALETGEVDVLISEESVTDGVLEDLGNRRRRSNASACGWTNWSAFGAVARAKRGTRSSRST